MKDAIEFWKSEYSKPHSECQVVDALLHFAG